MPDVYASIAEMDQETQKRLADIIELRFSDPRQQAMLREYISEVEFSPGARVLEIGCGTGAVCRTLARWPGVGEVTGVDPSPVFISRARELAGSERNVFFEEGDGRALRFNDGAFDVVVVHTTLSHVPSPHRVVAEAFRVLGRGGWIAAFDGDYATATASRGRNDPLQACVEAFRENYVNDVWIVRRLPGMLEAAGFSASPMRSHGYVESPEAGYMLTWIDRGADVLASDGRISQEHADALKAEARRRSSERAWFGHIAFASILGRKSA